ncbi:hypothetical protein ACWN8P_12640 [Vagococcus salmoninarum]|uniref:Uncharacterized protein n=1 Tax=Vagococcus salmoninarum TaxID=2739 RepID=A0A429ZSI8_9ENTE|nr:hypothetical protein [Vagococcus salmoninarum]RST96635.1 hypothetical protein CBF35_05225 [Vagococcus salmoninarum]
MTIEKNIEKTVSEFLKGGNIEVKVEEKLGEAIDKALNDLFGYGGDLKKLLENQINAAIVPAIERHDFSEYVTKLEPVLIKILQETTFENNKVLENFKGLAIADVPKDIKISEIFAEWCKYVAKEVNTDGLEVEYDDEPRYEYVACRFESVLEDGRSWSNFEHGIVRFECEKDESLNVEFNISKYRGDNWDINLNRVDNLSSLQVLNDFDVYMMNLSNKRTKLILDCEYEEEEVLPDAEPEASFS